MVNFKYILLSNKIHSEAPTYCMNSEKGKTIKIVERFVVATGLGAPE